MKLIIEIIIYIIFTYGLLSIMYGIFSRLLTINIKDIHKNLNRNEKVEVLIIFRNIEEYKKMIERRLLYGEYTNLLEVVDEYRCISLDSGKTLTLEE